MCKLISRTKSLTVCKLCILWFEFTQKDAFRKFQSDHELACKPQMVKRKIVEYF